MRVTFYSAVVLVAAGSVVMGLDWMSAPMPPMPAPKNVVFAPPPPPPPPRATATSSPTPNASQSLNQSPSVNAAPAASVAAPVAPPIAPPLAAAVKIRCDADACAAAYRSFRESDCTYNPSYGPRRLCTKGDPAKFITVAPAKPTEESAPVAVPTVGEAAAPAPAPDVPGSIMAPEPGSAPAAAPARCNVSACAAAYRSFRESDCTFNPSSGPRRVCER